MPRAAEPEEIGAGPAAIEESRAAPVRPDLLGDAAYNLPVVANTWVEAELNFLVTQRREVVGRWLSRADHYEEHVIRVLEAEGVPTDLHHLAMIESGYLPTARSRAGAVGLWQFMPATGRQMGLRVDEVVDERMDPVRSTRAAARHLRWLHNSFGGDWALAAAAYNAGSGRVSRSMQRFGAADFWELAARGDLAAETKHYVPRLYAMTIIGRNRTRFGFAPRVDARVVASPSGGGGADARFAAVGPALRPIRGAATGFAYDSIEVDLATPFSELARFGDVTAAQLAQLNPHLVRRTTPAGRYWLWVPAGTGAVLQEAYAVSDFRRDGGLEPYTVRRGDRLATLVELTGIEPERVRELNAGVDFEKLQAGQRLTLPAAMARALAARPAPKAEPKLASADRGKTSGKPGADGAYAEHRIEPGETLWGIARRYDVTVAQVQAANELKGSTIVPGRTLRIPRAATTVAAAEPPARGAAKGGEGQGKSASTERREAARKAEPVQHTVESGESLWAIARRYDSTVEAIQAANGLRSGVIRPGQTLKIPQ